MSKKLYISNLPFSVNDATLNQLFGEIGNVVSAKVITDRDTGRSKGFGFVEMSTEEEATNAIKQINGVELNGRAIGVAEARPQAPRDNTRGGGGGYGRDRNGGGGGYGRGGY